MNQVICNSCGFAGDISEYHPSLGLYTDCRCPKCGSTNNKYNDEYADRIYKAFKKLNERSIQQQ